MKKPQKKAFFANLLHSVRAGEGLSRAELARLARVSEKTLGYIENGTRKPREHTLYRIVNGLNQNPNRTRRFAFEDVFPTGGRPTSARARSVPRV